MWKCNNLKAHNMRKPRMWFTRQNDEISNSRHDKIRNDILIST